MSITSTIILSLTICIDSFLLCLLAKTNKKRDYIYIPLIFSIFQTIFLLTGYLIGEYIENFLQVYLKYIIFLIFCFMATKILVDSLINKNKETNCCFTLKNTVISACLTSFDSLFLGLPLAFNSENYFNLLIIMGLATFIMCLLGLLLRKKAPNTLDDKTSIIGSIILFIFAFKSLL